MPHGEPVPAGSADLQLVEAVHQKDRKATAEFVDLHADAIYAYVERRLLPRTELTDDLVQEVFLAAWEKLGHYRGDAPLRHWLLGIARHKVEDYYRSRMRQPDCEVIDEAAPHAAQREVPDLDERLDREGRDSRTRQVLELLPEPYAVLLQWRYWEKRSTAEIAAQTGKTEKAVERMLARAREQFRKRWKHA